jgi:hypothetical protein
MRRTRKAQPASRQQKEVHLCGLLLQTDCSDYSVLRQAQSLHRPGCARLDTATSGARVSRAQSSSCRLQGCCKIDRIAVGKVEADKNAPLQADFFFEHRVD